MGSSGAFIFLLSMVANVLIGCHGQFKIIGLLSDKEVANPPIGHQTNAQPRTFSDISEAAEAAEQSAMENNLIKVHLMDSDAAAIKNVDLALGDANSNGSIESSSTTEVAIAEVTSTVPIVTTEAEKKKNRKYRPHLSRLRKLSLDGAQHNSILFYRGKTARLPFYQNHAADLKFNRVSKYRNQFMSKCRCSPITNCPKLQITVGRCETDLFLCCFD